MSAYDNGLKLELFTQMVRVRKFEEQVQNAYLEGLVYGTTHLSQGQEAVSVGVVSALEAGDTLTYTYRGHGVCIARGMSMEGAFGEIFGRETGVSGGLGGSMHLTDPDLGLIGSAGIVGGSMPMGAGAALAAKMDGNGRVSATFFGDGSTNIGAFHETMNLASVWKLPLIFVCENNLYGEFSRIDHTTPFEDLYRRAEAYAMPAVKVDGNDVLAVLEAAEAAVLRGRDDGGPTFIECKTYRHAGHSRTDPGKYRAAREVEEWLTRDPIPTFAAKLVDQGVADQASLDSIAEHIEAEVLAASKAAADAGWPSKENYAREVLVAQSA